MRGITACPFTTWRMLLTEAMLSNGENFPDDVISTTLTDNELDQKFNDGLGLVEGCPFTVWTNNFVYFPAASDGSEWVASVPRNPNGVATQHISGDYA